MATLKSEQRQIAAKGEDGFKKKKKKGRKKS